MMRTIIRVAFVVGAFAAFAMFAFENDRLRAQLALLENSGCTTIYETD